MRRIVVNDNGLDADAAAVVPRGARVVPAVVPALDAPEPLEVAAVAAGVVAFSSVGPPASFPLPKIKLVASSTNGSVVKADEFARLAEIGSTVSR